MGRVRLVWLVIGAAFAPSASAQTGVIATVAGATRVDGGPVRGYSGDGAPARLASFALANMQNECDPNRFEQISHLAVDGTGNLYVADSANHRLRRVSPSGVVTTVAGNGQRPQVDPRNCNPLGGSAAIGEGGAAAAAVLFGPAGVAVHPAGGLLIADQQNNRVRRVLPDGSIVTIAGNGLHAFYAPVPALNSGLDWPTAVAVSPAGLVHFSELHSGRVARIEADGRLTTVAGTGIPGFNGASGLATSTRLSTPTGIAFDAQGNLYIADQGNHRVRKVTPAGALTTVAGSAAGFAGDGGPAAEALLDRPADVKVDRAGNIYVSDLNNHRVRRIDPGGVITTVAGDGMPGRGPDGAPATASSLAFPSGLAIDADGDVFIVDWGNYLVRKLSFRGLPAVASNGVVNAASFAGGVAPGSLITLFGLNLAASTEAAAQSPWPRELAGTSVRLNGAPLPLYFVSPGQLNAQLPYGLAAGDALVEVRTARGASAPEFLRVAGSSIGVFAYPGSRRAIALNQDNSINGPDRRESRGRAVTIFLTGIGAVSPEIGTGEAAPFGALHRAQAEATATLGGVPAPVLFLGLTPGFIGLAQANLLIPETSDTGELTLDLGVGGQPANPVTVWVQ